MKKKALVYLVLVLVALGLVTAVLRKRDGRGSAEGDAASASADPALTEGPRKATPLKVLETVYDGKLAPGWDDWGWGPHDLDKGPARVVFGGFGGITLHHAELPSRFGGLSFRFRAPPDWPHFLSVSLKRTGGANLPAVDLVGRHIAPLPDGWQEVLVDWHELNPSDAAFDRIAIAARVPVGQDWVLIDKVVLTAGSGTASGASHQDTLRVSCRGPTRAIDPMIYGAAGEHYSSGQTARRFGGNTLTRTNWETGAWNTGSDWFFRNVSVGKPSTLFDWVEDATKQGKKIALTVPLIGWVAKDDKAVGFPRSKFGAQRKHDPDVPEAGDGFKPDGKPIKPGPPTQTSIAAPPELVARWVKQLLERDKARGSRSVQMYILDNEPSLWNETHRDVHPEPVGYDELMKRTIDYASVIREADPQAVIAGPAEWGWTGYLYSAVDREEGTAERPDRLKHGDVPLIPWYLQQLSAHQKATGKRLLDVLDVHFYPAAEGIFGGNARTDPESAELRLRSTRALWDPTYKDESWIKDTVKLIPRLKEWVATSYPGTKLSLGEWSFGADEHISGGLATAEALGRFGQHGLDAAFYWGGPKPDTATYWAFRAFLDFDGKGGRFLDTSVTTRETERVSMFASRDSSGKHLVLVLVNRDPNSASDATIELDGCAGNISEARSFGFAAGSKELATREAKALETRLTTRLPPYSFAVVDLKLAQ